MKKVILTVCIAAIAAIACAAIKASAEDAPAANQVVAYYFHGNFRCANCLRIEQYSKEAIEKYFPDELKSGTLVYKVINVEEKGNEHFVKDYRLYTKSLVISLVKDGKEIKSENLAKVWECLGNRNRFHEYVKTSVDAYLKELHK